MKATLYRTGVLLTVLLGSSAAMLAAQDTAAVSSDSARAVPHDTTVVVERVVAVVGNRPVLASQVDEEIFSRQSQGAKIPDTPDGLKGVRQQIVSTIIDEELQKK